MKNGRRSKPPAFRNKYDTKMTESCWHACHLHCCIIAAPAPLRRFLNCNCQKGKYLRSQTKHMCFRISLCVCVLVCDRVCVCVCVCIRVRAFWNASVYRNLRAHVSRPRVCVTLGAFIKLWCITCIAYSFVITLSVHKTQLWPDTVGGRPPSGQSGRPSIAVFGSGSIQCFGITILLAPKLRTSTVTYQQC